VTDIQITYAIVIVIVALFVTNRIPVAVVALAVPLSLWATGILDLHASLAGFGDPTVIFIATLFVMSEALTASGVTTWAGRMLAERSGGDRRRLIVLMMIAVAVLTAFINPNGSVAALFPAVVVVAVRTVTPASKLLIPLAFGAHAGSMLLLTGSPVSVLASETLIDLGGNGFGFFSFALIGIPLVLGAIAIVLAFGDRLLPERHPRRAPSDFSAHAHTLMGEYGLEGEGIYTREQGVAEVVIPPRSPLIGQVAYQGMVTDSGDLVVVAIRRDDEALDPGEHVLQVGDALLLKGAWSALDEHLDTPEVLVVDPPEQIRRQVIPLGFRARETLFVLVGMVILLATGAVPAAIAGLVAACALILLGVLTPSQAYRGISWTTVILVGGMIPLSTAMIQTGAAEQLAEALVDLVGSAGPTALVAALVLVTFTFGQLISNTATALIILPVGVSAAAELAVSPRPVLMAIAVAASAAYITPVATPANLMIMEPGGYRFGDYWKLGSVMLVLSFAVAVFLVPVYWPF
jgi:di/tricarboxylate transporter